jgi:transcriptional regulator with XRE-family HTH domain
MGLLLRRWRERRGLSLRALGARARMSYATIAKIEAGRMSPTVTTLEKLAGALDIDVRDLFEPTRRASRRTRRGR